MNMFPIGKAFIFAAAIAPIATLMAILPAQAALVIAASPTTNVTCTHQVCTATAENAVLSVKMLQNHLARWDLTLVSGSIAGDIEIDGAVSWVSAHKLTLDSFHSVTVNSSVAVAGPGGLTIKTNDGGTAGDFSFGPKGHVTFWSTSDSLVIDESPYTLVNNIATLASDIASRPSRKYALAADYDASADGVYALPPITTVFTGVFEGLGNKISNLTINKSSNYATAGLFRSVETGGLLDNVRLVKVSIYGLKASVGALAGILAKATIENSFVEGIVSGKEPGDVGGLVGTNNGTILNSHMSGTVKVLGSKGQIGGIAGSSGGWIKNSYSTARVIGRGGAIAGGLVGANSGVIDQSWSNGAVVIGDNFGERSAAGGLAGQSNAIASSPSESITNCYAWGSVTGGAKTSIGGLIGMTQITQPYTLPVEQAYSTGSVTTGSGSFVGGSVGSAFTNEVGGNPSAGNQNVYWDTNTSGVTDLSKGIGNVSNASGVSGLNTTQLQSGLPAGFDPSVWGQSPSINGGLPYLLNNPPPG